MTTDTDNDYGNDIATSTNTITIDNDNNAASAIDNGEGDGNGASSSSLSGVVSVSPYSSNSDLVISLDKLYRRPKNAPKVGMTVGDRRVIALAEEILTGFLVVGLVCPEGHKTYCRWYSIRTQQNRVRRCAICTRNFHPAQRGRLTNQEARMILDNVGSNTLINLYQSNNLSFVDNDSSCQSTQ